MVESRRFPLLLQEVGTYGQSVATPEADDFTAIAFGRTTGWELFPLAGNLALSGDLQAEFAARVGFAVERLGDGGRAANLAEGEDLDFEVASIVGNAEHVADADFPCGLAGLAVGENAAEIAGAGGECARLKEARDP